MPEQNLIRNISIIAHIDHGKTTLTDRMLLLTDSISKREFHDRLLDSNPIEQERGITIKLAPVTMTYQIPNPKHEITNNKQIQNSNDKSFGFRNSDFVFSGSKYTLNLIDTPGHVDFNYEVERSLAACEGAVLLIDATQGIQAQTLSNFYKAQKLGLKIIVVLNKIDLPAADTKLVSQDIADSLQLNPKEFIHVSAKTGLHVDQVFQKIIKKIPPPSGQASKPTRGFVFNSTFHPHKGAIAFIKVVDGSFSAQELMFVSSKLALDPQEIGIFTPQMKPLDTLQTGQVGYIATGLKDASKIKIGDTVTVFGNNTITPLPGYQEPLPTVYLDLYPLEGKDFPNLTDALEKLSLSDSSLEYNPTSSVALGKGYQVGFLGALHAEIVIERLKREYNLDLIPTAPTVIYKITLTNDQEQVIKNPSQLPNPSSIKSIQEPVASVTIYTPPEYLGGIMDLVTKHRGELQNQTYIGTRIKLEYLIPLAELIINFFDRLKSVSSGYASLEYEILDYQPVDAVKLQILINHEPIEALSQIVVKQKARELGKSMVSKLKNAIPRQLFTIPIQAAIGGDIIARETIKALRKDVTAKLYGGDITRRKKLLEKQKKGKRLRSQHAKVEIPQSAYLSVLRQ